MIDLREYKAWALRAASGIVYDKNLIDDVAQEMLLEVWSQQENFNPELGRLEPFLKQRGIWKARDLLSGNSRYTGSPRRRASVSAVPIPEVPPGEYLSPRKDYEVRAAVLSLSEAQREYVFYRFWLGCTPKDLQKIFGYNPNSLWSSPKNGARLKLMRALSPQTGAPGSTQALTKIMEEK